MADDELAALRRITRRRQRAEAEWRKEICRLFEAGHGIEEIAAARFVRRLSSRSSGPDRSRRQAA
jgi:hypothetical protein